MIDGGKEYQLARRRDTPSIVGNFYTQMVATIVDGVVTPKGQLDLADVHNLDLGLRVEVKARNSNNHFGLKLTQLHGYDKAPFFIDHTLYCLVSYCHRGGLKDENGLRPNLLRRSRTRESKYSVLARKVQRSYLIDLPLLTALEHKHGTCTGLFIGEETLLKVKRERHLQPLERPGFRRKLRALKLNPADWVVEKVRLGLTVELQDEYTDESYTNQVVLDLVTILREDAHERVMPVILSRALTHT